MNETSVNLRLLHLIEGNERNAESPQLNERGLCSLNIVHNAFKIRGKFSNFDLEKIMNRACHKLYGTSIF